MALRSRWFPWSLLGLALVLFSRGVVAADGLGPWGMGFFRPLTGIIAPLPLLLEGRGPTRAAFTVFATELEVNSPAGTVNGLKLLRDRYGYPIHGVWIETQHIRFGPQQVRPLLRMGREAGFQMLVRVPTEARRDIQGYLDAGAGGLVVPVIERREQVREAFQHTYYRAGREMGFGDDSGNLQTLEPEHLDAVDDEKVLAFMIESVGGVEGIHELIAEATELCEKHHVTKSHLVFWWGPYDLKLSFRRRFGGKSAEEQQRYADESLAAVARAVTGAGFSMGGHMPSIAVGDRLVQQNGFRIFTIPGIADSTFHPGAVSLPALFRDADETARGRFRQAPRLTEGEIAALMALQACVGAVVEEGRRGAPQRAPGE